MKAIYRFMAVVLALALVFSLGSVALADEGGELNGTSSVISPAPEEGALPLTVQLNGQMVNFPDAVPEMRDDRTMVPVRAIAEAMGCEVGFDNDVVTIKNSETAISFMIGSADYTVKNGEDVQSLKMDTVPYISSLDRTYVPVRFFAEAMGMTVAWDESANMAVIYDSEALAANIDKNFTVFNSWMSEQPETDLNAAIQAAAEYSVGIAILGDEKIEIGINGALEMAYQGQNYSIKASYDMSDLAGLIVTGATEEEAAAAKAAMEEMLSNIVIDIIYDGQKDIIYMHSVQLASILSSYVGFDINPDAWFSFEGIMGMLYGDGMASIIESASDIDSVGDMVVYFAELGNASEIVANTAYVASIADEIIGDDQWVKSGSRYTASFNAKTAGEDSLLKQFFEGSEMSELNGKIVLNGSAVELSFEIADANSSVELNVEADETTAVMSMLMKIDGVEISMDMDMTQTVGGEAPVVTLPEGAVVVPLNNLLVA